jgi:hypothetical protein
VTHRPIASSLESRPTGRKVRQIIAVASKALGEQEIAVRLWAIRDKQPQGRSNATYRPIARQRLAKHIPTGANASNNRTSIARQRITKDA